MMTKGQRTIDGKVYRLGGRITGIDAKGGAAAEASAKRRAGKLVRIVKVSNFDYMIYEL